MKSLINNPKDLKIKDSKVKKGVDVSLKIGLLAGEKAKEKAEELVNKFKPYMYPFGPGSAFMTGDRSGNSVMEDAKKCALICVQEILLSNPHSNPFNNDQVQSTMVYWNDVKKEIEKS